MYRFVMVEGRPDAERRCCKDCYHLQGAVNLWCVSKAAARARGTALPGTEHCEFWEPCEVLADLSWWQRFWAKLDISRIPIAADR